MCQDYFVQYLEVYSFGSTFYFLMLIQTFSLTILL